MYKLLIGWPDGITYVIMFSSDKTALRNFLNQYNHEAGAVNLWRVDEVDGRLFSVNDELIYKELECE